MSDNIEKKQRREFLMFCAGLIIPLVCLSCYVIYEQAFLSNYMDSFPADEVSSPANRLQHLHSCYRSAEGNFRAAFAFTAVCILLVLRYAPKGYVPR